MQQPEWASVKELFHDALELPPEARDAFVKKQTTDNPALGERVLALLAAHDTSSTFLETPAAALHAHSDAEPLPSNGRVGPYQLLREIGRGGMGAVYLATRVDGGFEQQVAVKLVKRGMDTDRIVERFRQERQILAALEHPNIARLLDGGTTSDGRPYFVMEYVEGVSIAEHCETRQLPVNERLALFRAVCGAVQYAHQNLVVHRDIKSTNIIVTPKGVPKLLDFGIAKLLDLNQHDTQTATADAVRAMTPEYASPEQLLGKPVTTATDVYSLGVLLYELLAGRRPFSLVVGRADDVARAVCETEPPAPSAAVEGKDVHLRRRALRGDLDTIVLMAMRKDPRRRYSSVDHLSDDVNRFLEGRPVVAQRDRFLYRATKYVHRNRVGVAAGALVLASLVGGLATATWQARVARAERARADRRFNEVRSLATTFLFDLHDAIAELPGATPAREMLVKRALASFDELAKEAPGDAVLQRELGVAYTRIGNVQGNSAQSNLGDTPAALKSYHRSVQLLEDVVTAGAHDDATAFSLATAHHGLATLLSVVDSLPTSLQYYERSRASLERLVAAHPDSMPYLQELASVYREMGEVQGGEGILNVGDTPNALVSFRKSVALREEALRRAPRDVDARVGLASSLEALGALALTRGDTTAVGALQRAVSLLEGVAAERPNDINRRDELLSSYSRMRQLLADGTRYDAAVAMDMKTTAILDTMIRADPKNILFQRNRGVSLNSTGRDLRSAGRATEAIGFHQRALVVATQLGAADPLSAENRQDIATTEYFLGDALSDARRYDEALVHYERAESIDRALRKAQPSVPRHADDIALVETGVGRVFINTHKFAAADSVLADAVPGVEAALRRDTTSVAWKGRVATTYFERGREFAERPGDQSRCGEAMRWYERSLRLWSDMATAGTLVARYADRPEVVRKAMQRCTTA